MRQSEGRYGDADYYRSLPYRDLSGQMPGAWAIRAKSLDALVKKVVLPLEQQSGKALRILDLGAGNGWLSYRLSERGHSLAAVDLRVDSLDGLGACVNYPVSFLSAQADFDHLPFGSEQADLVIFNAAFHYSRDYEQTLTEAGRLLVKGGLVVVLDTPVYAAEESGATMVKERSEQYLRRYGFASTALNCENFLTEERLARLERSGISWSRILPGYGLRWRIRPLIARLLGRRSPAQFIVLVGKFKSEISSEGGSLQDGHPIVD